MQVSELKKSRALWETLEREQEIVLTRDGKPGAVMIPVTGESLDRVRKALRDARFAAALVEIRARTAQEPVEEGVIEAEIGAVRSGRGKQTG